MIILRALIVATEVYLAGILIKHVTDPARAWSFSSDAFLAELHETLVPWLGAVFAAVYAALYARFSAQWTYLAKATPKGRPWITHALPRLLALRQAVAYPESI